MRNFFIAATAAAALTLSGCSAADQQAGSGGQDADGTVTVLTHDSFTLDEEAQARFEEESGYTISTVSPGDAGMVLNQLILNKDNPTVDAVFGIDNFSAQQAVDEGVLAEYVPENNPGAEYGIADRLTATDIGDVCLNVDKQWFTEQGLAEPASFEDLTRPEYQDLTVVTNPATSSPGLAFLVGTVEHFGQGWQGYWQELLANGAKVSDSWSDAFYSDFSGADGEGPYPIVLSYSSSPAYMAGAIGNVEDTCVRQVEYSGVVDGAKNEEGAQAFVDFMVSEDVQASLPETMYVYPVDQDVELPAEWAEFASLAENPIVPDPSTVAANRNDWIKQWTTLFEAAR
ncbi:thiamine ABC transporter substrate-binding protein [Corynebacterium guangdongense]|uniref:Thiamine transport system substrate-binding protein n=1 Tax=Corynebacterium guangdongense TaxID=1783348 RepID=A0ABU1ZTT8_9CORY|nr:thiamine ABC transporter substrate-binding protein [Corynebacterium guangdongense]MDR7328349.1 thiamine transport system substrate-binding protein [Corynebacterium guangdongense]WJZ16926.1 Thiamine-binding periplasmic protein precursor [Corynebacterium guangdongense]